MPPATRMPATQASTGADAPCLGVDGCPAGWVCVRATPPPGCAETRDGTPLSWSWSVHTRLSDALCDLGSGLAVIDIPIGLSDGPPRPCDRQARAQLGPRRNSVFAVPMRGMLDMPTREAATDYGRARREGGGLSAQAWNILPKIREADALVTHDRQVTIREGHPELAFARIAGEPLADAKKTAAGAARRRALLSEAGVPIGRLLGEARAAHPRRVVADDDLVDAAVLALTARAVRRGDAVRLGGERDATGRVMEILG